MELPFIDNSLSSCSILLSRSEISSFWEETLDLRARFSDCRRERLPSSREFLSLACRSAISALSRDSSAESPEVELRDLRDSF